MNPPNRTLWAIAVAGLALVFLRPGRADEQLLQTSSPAIAPPISFSALAKDLTSKGKELQLRAEDLPALPAHLEYRHPPAVFLPNRPDIIQQLVVCDGKHCRPRVLRALEKDGTIDAQARLELPVLPKNASGLQYEPLGLLTLGSDGTDELLVRYNIDGPNRQGAGPKWTEMLAIVNLPEMTLALVHELQSGGRDGIDNYCAYQVTRLDLDGDGRLDLRFVRQCQCVDKKGCQPGAAPPEDFLAARGRRFVRRPATPPPRPVGIDQGR